MRFNEAQALAAASATALLAAVLRGFYTVHFFGYTLHTSDLILEYFFYELLGVLIMLNWRAWNRVVRAPSKAQKYISVSVALVAFCIPTAATLTNNPIDRIFIEYVIAAVRTAAIFLVFLPRAFFRDNDAAVKLVIGATTLMALLGFYMDAAWRALSRSILFGIDGVFSALHVPHRIDPAFFAVTVKQFTVYIGSECAGLGAITACVVLSVATYLLLATRGKITSPRRAIIALTLGIIGAVVVNFIRIITLIIIGAYISPSFAMNGFHSFAGAILFLIFLSLYMTWGMKYVMLKA